MENALLRSLIAYFTMVPMEVVRNATIAIHFYPKLVSIAINRYLIVCSTAIRATVQYVINISGCQILEVPVKDKYLAVFLTKITVLVPNVPKT